MTSRPFTVRAVTQARHMRALEDVQVAAWGYPDREVLPGTMLRISAATGGVVLAAYPEGSEVPFGLAYGFPAMQGGRPGHPPHLWHHSHLLAVAPGWRGSGAAVALKLAQRRAVLAQGLTRMTWTFDPLVARNARLNLGKLGARAVSYHPAWYDLGGEAEETPGDQNQPADQNGPADQTAMVPADRLMIEWDLTREHAERPAPPPAGEVVLEAASDSTPIVHSGQTSSAPQLLAEVPIQADTMPLPLRLKWRLALREVLGGPLGRGYAVTGLARQGERAWYVLERVQ